MNSKLDHRVGLTMERHPPGSQAAILAARRWLEGSAAKGAAAFAGNEEAVRDGVPFNAITLPGILVHRAEAGRVLCSLRVAPQLADGEGCWRAGAIAAVIDDVCAAAIMTMEGIIKVSVDFDISYFTPAKIYEEVELEGWIVEQKGKLTAVTVEIRKKSDGQLVAVGRQWMTSSRPANPKL